MYLGRVLCCTSPSSPDLLENIVKADEIVMMAGIMMMESRPKT